MIEKVKIYKFGNTYIFRKGEDSKFFFISKDSFIIPTFNFSSIIKFMLFRGLLSPKVLEGVLDEYYNYGK
jgi:hypothetical protein